MTTPDVSQELGAYARQPKNPNELLENKFQFQIRKLPEVSFRCRSFNLPSMRLPVAEQKTIANPLPVPGLHIDFAPLRIEFLLDEDLNNWMEIAAWMTMLGLPEDATPGYRELRQTALGPGPNEGIWSDAVGLILTNESSPNIEVRFKDTFPTFLDEVVFRNDADNPDLLYVAAEFQYASYTIEKIPKLTA